MAVIPCGRVTAILVFCYSVLNSLLVLTVLVLIIIGTTLCDLHMTLLSGTDRPTLATSCGMNRVQTLHTGVLVGHWQRANIHR